MAVPKKRMSRMRKLLRRTQWNLLIRSQALKALSLGYSGLGNLSEGTMVSSTLTTLDENNEKKPSSD
jgi:ribosomal protein L32